VFVEAKDNGGVGNNWTTGAISRAKLQSNHHHQEINIQFFYRPDALPVDPRPTNIVKALKEKALKEKAVFKSLYEANCCL